MRTWRSSRAPAAVIAALAAAAPAAASVHVGVIPPSATNPVAELVFMPSNLAHGCGAVAAAARGSFPAVLTLREGGRAYTARSRSLCDTLGFSGQFWSWGSVLGDPTAGGFLFEPVLASSPRRVDVTWQLVERGHVAGKGRFAILHGTIATTKAVWSGTYAYLSDCARRPIHTKNGIRYCDVPGTRAVTTLEVGVRSIR